MLKNPLPEQSPGPNGAALEPVLKPVAACRDCADSLPCADTLAEIEMWVFDLDNTLYPASCNLFSSIDERMKAFIARDLGVAPEDAWHIQKRYFEEYGTTLKGLMQHHGTDPHEFLAYVHEVDLSPLCPDPTLGQALAALDGRKVIYTNGSRRHAERVLERLEIGTHFEGIFDIIGADYIPKPHMESYRKLAADFGIVPQKAALFEDLPRNLVPAAQIGMTTVWVRHESPWGSQPQDDETGHIHHITDDLAGWLKNLVQRRRDTAKTG